jgi:predicted transposase YdaD
LKGRQETVFEIARRMKQKGIGLETLMEITGITSEEIGRL